MYLIKVYKVNQGNTYIEPDYELIEQAQVKSECIGEIINIMDENNITEEE